MRRAERPSAWRSLLGSGGGAHGERVVGATVPRRVVPLSSIARFVGEGELAVELRDGSRLGLGLRLEGESAMGDLVSRLDGALVEARAAGGYRGRAQRASQR